MKKRTDAAMDDMEKMRDDFFTKNVYYREIRLLLMAAGLWPFQSKTSANIVLFLMGPISHTILVVSVLKMFECYENIEEFLNCFPMLLLNTSACIRHINNYVNMENTKKILIKMQEDWSSTKDEISLEMLRSTAERGRNLGLAYAVYLYISASIFVLTPSIPQIIMIASGENYTLGYDFLYLPVYYPGIDDEKYFFLLAGHVVASAIFNMTIFVSIGGIFMVTIQHACGLYQIVGYQIEHCADGEPIDIDLNPPLNQDIPYLRVVDAIRKHQSIIEHIELIESTYAISFLFLLLINMILISFTGFETIMHLSTPHLVFRYGSFTIGQMIHLFFECLQGQQLTDNSEDLRDAALRACWYRMSVRTKVLLKFVIMRCEVCSKITAGRLYPLNFESYSQIVRTSMSYFTMLKSTQ